MDEIFILNGVKITTYHSHHACMHTTTWLVFNGLRENKVLGRRPFIKSNAAVWNGRHTSSATRVNIISRIFTNLVTFEQCSEFFNVAHDRTN